MFVILEKNLPLVRPISTRGNPMKRSIESQVWDCSTFNRIALAHFPASTKYHLASLTGISHRTVEKHLRGEARPAADHCLAYFHCGDFGTALMREFLPDAKFDQGGIHVSQNSAHCINWVVQMV